MVRVDKAEERLRTIITVDGQLLRDCIEIVETCCEQAIANGKPVHLLLRDLTAIDPAGRAVLVRLARKGVHLLANGVYTSYVVRTVNSIRNRSRPA